MSTLLPVHASLFKPQSKISFRDFIRLGADPLQMQEAFDYVLHSFRGWGAPSADQHGFETFVTAPSFVKKIVKYSPIALLLLAALKDVPVTDQDVIVGVLKTHSQTSPRAFFQETKYIFSPALPLTLQFYLDLEAVHAEWALSTRIAEAADFFGLSTRRTRLHSWEMEMKHLSRKWNLRYNPPEEPLSWAARVADLFNGASHWLTRTFGI